MQSTTPVFLTFWALALTLLAALTVAFFVGDGALLR